RSTDNGANWTVINSGMSFLDITAIAINSNDHLFAAGTNMGGSMYRSMNNGDTWTEVINGLTNVNIQAITIDLAERIYVGTSGGAFMSDDNGDSWTEINNGLTTLDIRSLTVDANGQVIAGTAGGGVFKLDLSTAIAEAGNSDQLGVHNYPNPVSTSTTIVFDLPESTRITLNMFDMHGRQLAQLLDQVASAGRNTVQFDATGLQSGVYYYSLTANGRSVSRPMLIVK
ncbi:MAG: T9SS type A sorting domain-containing protein, partial [Bacteroidota bacterium]|nr:T9SS type A sorting domain-containing protein [Bacteroidota bacterium]